MVADIGAKNGIIPADEKAEKFLKGRTNKKFDLIKTDLDAEYFDILNIDITQLEPYIAVPPLPDNVVPVRELSDVKVNQVFLGSCTNGRYEDLEIGAKIVKGKKINSSVRLIVIPESQEIYKKAMDTWILNAFVEAGAIVGPPTCGPCHGGHLGLRANGEVTISSTNRNFEGRMGSKISKIYLSSPATVAASALTGIITDPRDFL